MDKLEDLLVQFPDNNCVMCGAVIPDGKQYCPECEAKAEKDERHAHIRQMAYDEACTRFYYGTGSRGYETMFSHELSKKELKEIWGKAFWYMAESKQNEFRQSF